jgi:hypothetical protein
MFGGRGGRSLSPLILRSELRPAVVPYRWVLRSERADKLDLRVHLLIGRGLRLPQDFLPNCEVRKLGCLLLRRRAAAIATSML